MYSVHSITNVFSNTGVYSITANILDSDSDDDNTITINLNSDSDDEISDQPSGVETRDAEGNLTTEYRAMLNTLQRRQERRERQLVNILQHRRFILILISITIDVLSWLQERNSE